MKLCEICGNKGHHSHHIQSKSLRGKNTPDNLCVLCGSCHSEVHLGNIIINGRFFSLSSGYELIYHKRGEESITGQEPKCFLFGKTA